MGFNSAFKGLQCTLTLILLTWRIWWALHNASRWQMGFNSAFKGLQCALTLILLTWRIWWAPNNATRWQMGFNLAFKGLKDKHWYINETCYEICSANIIVSLNEPFCYWFSEVIPRKHVLKCRLVSLSFANCSFVWTQRIARKLSTGFPFSLDPKLIPACQSWTDIQVCKADGKVSAKHTVEMMFVAGM